MIRTGLASLCLFCLSLSPALAEDTYHVTRSVSACVDPQATRALANAADPRNSDPNWVQSVETQGRCFSAAPSEAWDLISSANGLMLMRRDPPRVGMPPLYFLPDQLEIAAPPEASASQSETAVQSPDSASAETPSTDESSVLPQGWQKPNTSNDTSPSESTTEPAAEAAPTVQPAVKTSPPDHDSPSVLRFWWVALLGFAAIGVMKQAAAKRRRDRAWSIIDREITSQTDALQVRRLQLATPDHYGTINLQRWQKEIGYFCESRLMTLLAANGLAGEWPALQAQAFARIEYVASQVPEGARLSPAFNSDPRVFDTRMDPIHYEHHCALLLRQAGWDARVTQASGDQGADVIATRNGRKVVVQCKLYSQPVGNTAVQEAYAAQQHQRADAALVVSNASFTAAARQLANTTGVYLLHHQQLASF